MLWNFLTEWMHFPILLCKAKVPENKKWENQEKKSWKMTFLNDASSKTESQIYKKVYPLIQNLSWIIVNHHISQQGPAISTPSKFKANTLKTNATRNCVCQCIQINHHSVNTNKIFPLMKEKNWPPFLFLIWPWLLSNEPSLNLCESQSQRSVT